MGELLAVPLDIGGSVVVQIDDGPAGVVKAGRGRSGEAVSKAAESLEAALDPVAMAARAALAKLREVNPHAIELEFGIKFTAEIGAVITKTVGECNLKVTLRWERADESS